MDDSGSQISVDDHSDSNSKRYRSNESIRIKRKKSSRKDKTIRELQNIIAQLQSEIALSKQRNEPTTSNVSIQNRFETLSHNNESNDKCNMQNLRDIPTLTKSTSSNTKQNIETTKKNMSSSIPLANPTTILKVVKPPPLLAYKLNHKLCIDTATKSLGHKEFTLKKLNANCTQVSTKNLEDYDKMKDILHQGEVEFHSFTPKQQKKINIVVRHIDDSYSDEDIIKGIEELALNITVSKVEKFSTERSRRNQINLPLWLIQLEPSSKVQELLGTKYMLNQRVSFEKMKTQGTSQCRNCQNYGHSATNCSRKYRCVKCLNEHEPGKCNLASTINESSELIDETTRPKASCVNCKSTSHPANYRGCPAYAVFIQKRQIQVSKAQELQDRRRNSYKNYVTPKISYANVVSRENNMNINKNNTTGTTNCLELIERECQIQFGIEFNDLIKKAANFAPNYVTLNERDKPLALLKFMISIAPVQLI